MIDLYRHFVGTFYAVSGRGFTVSKKAARRQCVRALKWSCDLCETRANHHLGRYATHLEQDDIMNHITIWHNPRCSKSRVTLGLLQERGIDPVQVKYLENPPTDTEIRAALIALKIPPFELMRRNEVAFKELKLSKESTDDELIAAMATHPILIERPIVFAGKKDVIGRPPENVLRLLED